MKELLITIDEISSRLKVSPITVYRWINWWNSDLQKPENVFLPNFVKSGRHKLFKESDFCYFEKFHQLKKRGIMSDYNNFYFGRKHKVSKEKAEQILVSHRNQKEKMK